MNQPAKKALLVLLLFSAVACLGMAPAGDSAAKWVGSAGLLLDIAGLVQLKVSGLFDGIDDPRPAAGAADRGWIQDKLFFDRRTGFWMIVIGFAEQVAGIWL